MTEVTAHIASPPETVPPTAQDHMWAHFTPLAIKGHLPVIVRGEGCYLEDDGGNRYLDGLSSLFCVNIGHGRRELAEAAARQAARLAFYPCWGATHPAATELANRVSELAPPGLNRVFFTSGGAEAIESALKLSRAYHFRTAAPQRTKFIARELAYHGTTLGALSITGLPSIQHEFGPLLGGVRHVPNTNAFRLPADVDELHSADAIEAAILAEDPETVAAVILEPVQNAGGCFPPPPGYFRRVREICDRYGVLLVCDEVICAWGRLGHWFGCQRYEFGPDLIATAKGITSGYTPMGALVVSDRVAEPFVGTRAFAHGFTFGGHPVASAVALKNIEIMEREDLPGRVRALERDLKEQLRGLGDIPIVGDVRGAGYFWAIELVKDQATTERFAENEARDLVARLREEVEAQGLICRVDDRGDPVIQVCPPLIAGHAEFDKMATMLRNAMEETVATLDDTSRGARPRYGRAR